MNENTLKGKWREIKADIQKSWGNLTDDELEKTKGDINGIAGLIQQRYGEAQESGSKKLKEIFERVGAEKDKAVKEVKQVLQ